MKRNFFKRTINLLILAAVVISVISLLQSQDVTSALFKAYHPGHRYLTDVSVRSLRETILPKIGLRRASFLSSVGGIAFGNTARPDNGLTVNNISLIYNPTAEDGKRLGALINGTKVSIPIHDWKLKPILLYSANKYYSCFSLFGTTGDREKDEIYKQKHQVRYLASYHPDFENTLVGLRLVHMDSFLTDIKNFDGLPKYDSSSGNVILGAGDEPGQIPEDSQSCKNRLITVINRYDKFQAYVITDFPVDIKFYISDTQLRLTGELYPYFWKRKSDDEIKTLYNMILEQVAAKYGLIKQEDGKFHGDPGKIAMAEKEIKERMDEAVILPLKALSDLLNQNMYLVKAINPVVYNCARDVMRYSAFFRYCKLKNPANFERIKERISRIDITPNIATPNGIE
jgi:hypothetical protein